MATDITIKVSSSTHSWADMVRKAWGSEFSAPDHGIYQFTGRRFDSTDKGKTGIYNGGIAATQDNPGSGTLV